MNKRQLQLRRRQLTGAIALIACLSAAPAFAWGPWGGWGPWENGFGPFSGYGGPFVGNMGPWSMGNFHMQGPHGGPMQFNSGYYGGYGAPFEGYYGGGTPWGYGPIAPAYPPEADYGYPGYGGYSGYAPVSPPETAYYGYPNQPQGYAVPPAQAAAQPAFVPPPPGPFAP